LVDQSNREGIVESAAFDDLKESIIYILNEIENRRYDERPREEKTESVTDGIFSKISITPVIEMVNQKLPDDAEAKKVVLETDSAIKEGIKHVQEVLSRYRRLSTLGLLLDVVLHDGNNILLKFDNELSLLDKEFKKDTVSDEKISLHINNVKRERQTMSQLFKRLEPFGGRKRGNPKNIVLEDAIKNVFALYSTELEKLQIKVSVPDGKTEIVFDESDFEIIFVNLLLNSIYWLDNLQQKDRKIAVEVSNKADGLNIIFSDNGPGIDEKDVEKIFEPYFSRKPDGIGLGLTTVGELVTEYNGFFELVNNGPLDGANFRIVFKRGL
jgi:C4-dicarboxylate-specific signal transduction histidine kinase